MTVTVFQLMLLVSLTSPQKGDATVSSSLQFPTEEMCTQHVDKIKPGTNALLRSIFGKEVRYTSVEYKCLPLTITDGLPGQPV